MTPSADDYTEAVSNGAALLDARVPGWRDRVDVAALLMQSCFECVLGQVFGGYFRGMGRLGITDGRVYGFTVRNTPAATAEWEALRLAWWKRVMA